MAAPTTCPVGHFCPNPISPTPFIESARIGNWRYDTRAGGPLTAQQQCVTAGRDCFGSNLTNAAKFLIIFFGAAMFINFLHELMYYEIVSAAGSASSGFTFYFDGGVANVTLPAVATMPLWWWCLATLGPLVVVNLGSLLLIAVLFPATDRLNRPFHSASSLHPYGWEAFWKSVGYTSAIIIIINVVLGSVTQFLTIGCDVPVQSDIDTAWQISHFMTAPMQLLWWSTTEGIVFDLIIVVVSGILLVLAFAFFFLYGKKNV